MKTILVLTQDDLRRVLPMADTIAAMKSAFEAFSSKRATVPQRLAIPLPGEDGVFLVKPALIPNEGLGAKLISVFPGNAQRGRPVVSGMVVLMNPATGEPLGLCDAAFLTAWRTGAASGAATDLLTRAEARAAALIGCGVQGRTQAIAVDTVRKLETLRLFDTDAAQVERFASDMATVLRARIVPCPSARAAVNGADIVCAATTSSEPVIHGDWLAAGTHLNGVGSFTPRMTEVDLETIRRARVVVDSRQAAAVEAGELMAAVAAGVTRAEEWSELGEVVAGSAPGRRDEQELTFFKSVGLAVQDVAAASLAFSRARELGLGTAVDVG